jgi:carbonic anhydrase
MSNVIDPLQRIKSKVHQQVLLANQEYVKHFGDKGELTIPPARQFAILTCMDARLDPANMQVWPKATPM